jgi:hypothetical protein
MIDYIDYIEIGCFLVLFVSGMIYQYNRGLRVGIDETMGFLEENNYIKIIDDILITHPKTKTQRRRKLK